MARRMRGADEAVGWNADAAVDAGYVQLRQRRWRILRSLLPATRSARALPAWVRTPEEFVRWVALTIDADDRAQYFDDLEVVALKSCDLELLRLARRYRRAAPCRA